MSDDKYKNSTCACDYGDVMGVLNGDEHFIHCPLAGEQVEPGTICAPLDRKELERKYIALKLQLTKARMVVQGLLTRYDDREVSLDHATFSSDMERLFNRARVWLAANPEKENTNG